MEFYLRWSQVYGFKRSVDFIFVLVVV